MHKRAARRLFLFLCALAPLVAQDAGSLDVIRARADLERLRGLVQVGAIAPAKLSEAEDALGDAQDDQVLRGTLYGSITAQDLTEKQADDMVAAAQRRLDRQKAKLDRYQKLVDAGVLARNELEPIQMELESRRVTVDLAENRSHLLQELAAQAKTESALMRDDHADHSLMQRFDGDGVFSPGDLKKVQTAFEAHFHKLLPISANGETSVHRALGFDHRGRVDVALNPDQPEGAWLRAYLQHQDIPFYAFRAALPGRATGPHIHIGPGSTRLRAAD
jgi:uncharacterized membrane-anchored protein YhcB (DUF1043 family)